MSQQIEKLDGSMAKLTIEVGADELEKAIEKAYQKNRGRISVPGFRKGKVPRQMIEKMYGKEIFYDDAANFLIPDAYEAAFAECGEEIVSSPQIEIVRIEAGQPFVFTAEVALKPEVHLGKYKGVKVEKADVSVSAEDIEAAIEKEREQNARFVVIDDRPVADGDMIILDFEGFVDGVPFAGGKAADHSLTIGSGAFIPGFEEQLVGAALNEEMTVNVTFPADYQAADLAGREAAFVCTVKEIKVKELPEVDDEFAAEVSEFDTLDEYRQDLTLKLAEDKEKAAKEAKEDAVIDAIIADSDIEIPEAMLLTQQRQLYDDFVQQLSMRGMGIEQYLQMLGMTQQALMEQMRPQADTKIRSRLVLEKIVETENISVTDEDYDAEMATLAESYRMEVDKVREMMGEKGKERIMKDLAVQKAVDFAVAQAKEK